MDTATREFAIALARRAGDLLLSIRERGLDPSATRPKMGHFDIVTEADIASEHLILNALHEAFPRHAVHAEESAASSTPDAEWLWLVDPVDGTTNFSHGLPIFAVNLALAHRGVPVLGVTHEPSNGRTYWAERGGGAWMRSAAGERRLRVSTVDHMQAALLATGFVHARIAGPDMNRAEFAALDVQAQSVRRLGSAAMVLAWVASGMLEAYWEASLKPWDYAPGWILVTEAGGRVTDYRGEPMRLDSPSMIASNGQPTVHETIMDTIIEVRTQLRR